MNRRLLSILAAMFVLAVPQLRAQIDEPAENDVRGRLGIGIQKDLPHGLDATLTQEFRMDNGFRNFDRFMTEAGLSYKPFKYLKMGLSYTLFSINDGIKEETGRRDWDFKHRVSFELTGLYKVGEWRFALREKLQATVRTDDFNHFQEPVTDLILRSRFKVSYKSRSVPLQPYVSVEPYVRLNAVDPASLATSDSEPGSVKVRYSKAYLSRVRSVLGLSWDIDSRNSFDFYFMGDAWFDKKIDATKKGVLKTRMVLEDGDYKEYKAIYNRHGFDSIIGIAYNFSF